MADGDANEFKGKLLYEKRSHVRYAFLFPQKNMGAMAEGDTDEFKRVLLEGNPYFLGLTFAVSMLHSVFDMLAFKNDIGFWKDKKTVEGLSVQTIFINCVCQVRSCSSPVLLPLAACPCRPSSSTSARCVPAVVEF